MGESLENKFKKSLPQVHRYYKEKKKDGSWKLVHWGRRIAVCQVTKSCTLDCSNSVSVHKNRHNDYLAEGNKQIQWGPIKAVSFCTPWRESEKSSDCLLAYRDLSKKKKNECQRSIDDDMKEASLHIFSSHCPEIN